MMMRFTFKGGVFDGHRLGIAAPYTPRAVWLVKAPPPAAQLEVLLVGTERLPPGPMFPDAVEYRLDRDASDLRPHPQYEGMEIGEAVYEAR